MQVRQALAQRFPGLEVLPSTYPVPQFRVRAQTSLTPVFEAAQAQACVQNRFAELVLLAVNSSSSVVMFNSFTLTVYAPTLPQLTSAGLTLRQTCRCLWRA